MAPQASIVRILLLRKSWLPCFRSQVHSNGRNRIWDPLTGRRVPIELGDKQVIVFHPKRELLHVDVVDCAVGGPQEQERSGSVVRSDRGGKFLRLPVLSHRVPDTDLSGGRQRDQLRADEEERVDGDVEVERSDVDPVSGLGKEHGSDFLSEGDGDHDGRGFASPAGGGHSEGPHLGIDGHPLDRQVEVWTKKFKSSCI